MRVSPQHPVRFGKGGGSVEVRYYGCRFTHARAEVFEAVEARFDLPICNPRFGSPLVPFFEPMAAADPDGHWSLSADYAFRKLARQCGFAVVVDTTIWLWHVGSSVESDQFLSYRTASDAASAGRMVLKRRLW